MLGRIQRQERQANCPEVTQQRSAGFNRLKPAATTQRGPGRGNSLSLIPARPNVRNSAEKSLPLAVRAAAIQVNEDIAGFSAFARADHAAILEFIHDPGSAGVAEAQAALHQGDAGLLFAANDFDALLDELLVFIAAAARRRGC